MDINLLSILVVGFALGMKHAMEPDHVIAVSTMASRSGSLWRSSLAGIFWGIGHTATLFIAGILVIALKVEITPKWAMSLEFIVGIMLVYLGLSNLLVSRQKQIHLHKNVHIKASGLKIMAIGLIHGLAGSAAMVVLTMSAVSSLWEGMLYIVVFGLGTVAGMLFFTTMIGIPFALTMTKSRINTSLTNITAAISTAFGVYYMYNLGINEGLFVLWLVK